MRYFFAIFCPPVALLLCGKPFQMILNIPMWCCGWFPGSLHALLVVGSVNAERRHKEHMGLVRSQNKEMGRQTKEMSRQTRELAKGAKAQESAARALERALDRAAQAKPTPISAPSPVSLPGPKTPSNEPDLPPIVVDEIEVELAPKKPISQVFREWIASLSNLKEDTIEAYRNLPEWAHPITWGLAAGSAVSVTIILVTLVKR